jgi:hypothetical protein
MDQIYLIKNNQNQMNLLHFQVHKVIFYFKSLIYR